MTKAKVSVEEKEGIPTEIESVKPGAIILSDSVQPLRQQVVALGLSIYLKYTDVDSEYALAMLEDVSIVMKTLISIQDDLFEAEWEDQDRIFIPSPDLETAPKDDEEDNKLSRVTDTFTNPFKVKS